MDKIIYLMLVASAVLSSSAYAGYSNGSEILQVEQRDDGAVKVQVNHGTYSELPVCSFSGGTFLFDGNTSIGKSMLSIALSALMSGHKVNIQLTTCYQFSNSPDTQLGKIDRITIVK